MENAIIDAAVGALGGYAGDFVKPSATRYAAGFKFRGNNLSEMGQKALAAGIGGAVDSGTQAIARPLFTGEPINPLKVVGSMAAGFAVGFVLKTYAKETAKAQYAALSPRAMAAARQFLSRVRSRMQAANPGEIKMLTAESIEMVAFASGRSGSVNGSMSNLAFSMAVSRVGL